MKIAGVSRPKTCGWLKHSLGSRVVASDDLSCEKRTSVEFPIGVVFYTTARDGFVWYHFRAECFAITDVAGSPQEEASLELMRCSSHTAQLMLDRAPVTWHCSSLTGLGFDGQDQQEPILCENDWLWRHTKLGQKIMHQDFLFPDPSATVCFVKLDIGRCMFLLDAISGPDMQQTGSAALVVGLRHQVQNLGLVVKPLETKPPLQDLVENLLETKPPFSDVVNAEEERDPDSIAEDRRQPNSRKRYRWPVFMVLRAVLLSYDVHDPCDIAAVVSASIGVATKTCLPWQHCGRRSSQQKSSTKIIARKKCRSSRRNGELPPTRKKLTASSTRKKDDPHIPFAVDPLREKLEAIQKEKEKNASSSSSHKKKSSG